MAMAQYKSIFETLREEIQKGAYLDRSRFPSDHELARRFHAGRQTVYQAVSKLQDCGLVRRERGSGTYLTRVARKKSGAIAVIVPSFPKVEIFPVICKELSCICREQNRLFVYVDDGADSVRTVKRSMRSTVERLVDQGVSGVIFRPVDYQRDSEAINREIISTLRAADIPLVLIDCDVSEGADRAGLDLVGVDNLAVGGLLGEHVVSCGARRVAYVYRAMSSANVDHRLLGIRTALEKSGKARLVGTCPYSEEGGDWRKWFRRTKPDAILCSGDIVAAKVLKTVQDIGLRIPEDVIVAGVDDVEIASVTRPSLTTVRQPCADIASAAFDLLEWRVLNPDAAARKLLLRTKLVVRESTRKKERDKP